ncbi:DUF432 domain-containing protein [Rheinheimera salexigens]|uniref:DUF432 domain-containing protein n=2 Tax=Rheinheimera salexigens TaxID=1628148 RepID=A0A1E7Q3H5_9GAMM|nr:hypothetical protein BI198_03425 [Rheinheimera salexigens]
MTFANNECKGFRIGALQLYLQRQAKQWLIATDTIHDDEKVPLQQHNLEMLPGHLQPQRYMFTKSPNVCRLVPQLLDRPVVVKTLQPVRIPPGERATFYISSPVCIGVVLPASEVLKSELILTDIAVQRLSDTWFGPSTQIGELCYADKTHARHSKGELKVRPHRAITPVHIHNLSEQMLAMDKISIPVPYLTLYGDLDGSLWTDSLTIQHKSLLSLASFKIDKLDITKPQTSTLLSPPRKTAEKHSLIRAFTDMLSD